MYNKIINKAYDIVLGNPHCGNPFLYEQVLNNVKSNSVILDIGIGNGSYFNNENVVSIIKSKNLKIQGVDLNKEYIDMCNKRITEKGLENYVSCVYKNITTSKISIKYDYIFFIQSFPVIPNEIMKSILSVCNKILKKDGSIIFVHNLTNKKNTIKEYIKYFTTVDFGKSTTISEFNDFIKILNYKIVKAECIYYNTLGGHIKLLANYYNANSVINFIINKLYKYMTISCNQYMYQIKTRQNYISHRN